MIAESQGVNIDDMKHQPEMIEGPEAWTRFTNAMKAIVTVKKSDMPPTPFGTRSKKKKPASPKAN